MGWGQLLGAGAGFFLGGPAGAALGASLGGAAEEVTGGGAAGAARDAAAVSNAAAERDIALRRQMYEEGIARQKPFLEMGTNALNRLNALNQPGTDANKFLTMDPGYAFRLSEGQKALERSAAARGGLLSGGTGKALTRYGQEMGSQEFQNAYNRLAGIANLGPSAAGIMNNLGSSYASGAGPTLLGQGETSANALLAGQRARESAYGQLGSALGKYLYPTQAQFSQTGLGSSGFGTGLAYGNQDYGQFF